MVNTFGTGRIADEKIVDLIGRHFDLRPKAIIQTLDLLRPIYSRTAALRPLRPRRAGLHLGTDRQGRRPARRRRTLSRKRPQERRESRSGALRRWRGFQRCNRDLRRSYAGQPRSGMRARERRESRSGGAAALARVPGAAIATCVAPAQNRRASVPVNPELADARPVSAPPRRPESPMLQQVLMFALGLTVLVVGADVLVQWRLAAGGLLRRFAARRQPSPWSPSAPARRRWRYRWARRSPAAPDLAIGNVVSSNICNVLLISASRR